LLTAIGLYIGKRGDILPLPKGLDLPAEGELLIQLFPGYNRCFLHWEMLLVDISSQYRIIPFFCTFCKGKEGNFIRLLTFRKRTCNYADVVLNYVGNTPYGRKRKKYDL
jgi:hypothetical protein